MGSQYVFECRISSDILLCFDSAIPRGVMDLGFVIYEQLGVNCSVVSPSFSHLLLKNK